MNYYKYILVAGIISFFLSSGVYAVILNVPSDYTKIKSAIIYAEDGDTILLASGTYTGADNTDLELGARAITLMSIKGPSATVIDCRGQESAPRRGFYIHQHEDNKTIIKGIAVVNGYAPNNLPIGGAVLVAAGSSPVFENCIFRHSFAADGGGGVGILNGSSPKFIDCIFENNWAGEPLLYGNDPGYGGGLYCNLGSPELSGCRFVGNSANYGGGVSASYSNISFDNCVYAENTSRGWGGFEPEFPGYGGGIHLYQSDATVSASLFYGNSAVAEILMNYLPGQGGGIAAFESALLVENSTFADNTAGQVSGELPGQGGAIYCNSTGLMAHASILAFSNESDACYFFDPAPAKAATLDIFCSDIYGNDAGDWVGALAGMESTDGNFSDNPVFCMGVEEIYNIETNSPCTPDNNSCNILVGYGAVGCITDTEDDAAPDDIAFELKQNHPNPFNLSTTIEFTISSPGRVALDIFNVTGQKVRALVNSYRYPGVYAVEWDGRDDGGRVVSSGIYFYRIDTSKFSSARGMILMK